MISPKDIRSGNQLLTLNDKAEWNTVVMTWGGIKWCEDFNEGFNDVHKPLPITPELLVKCGFYKSKELHNTWIAEIIKAEVIIRIFPDQVVLINSIIPIELKGFHHLQNILWDMCQVELTL